MPIKTMGITEARRLLPQIVAAVAREGGRVDITHRGEPRVSVVRTEDLDRSAKTDDASLVPDALRVELNVTPDKLVERIHELRSRFGRPRPFPPAPKQPSSRRSKKRGT